MTASPEKPEVESMRSCKVNQANAEKPVKLTQSEIESLRENARKALHTLMA